jgi:hypothetical protein
MKNRIGSFFAIMLALLPGKIYSQITPIVYTNPGSTYGQPFDSLPAAGSVSLPGKGPFALQTPPITQGKLSGWFISQTAGSSNQAGFYMGSGTSTAHGIYSAGLINNTDRSLGSISSSGGSYAFGVIFSNQTGKTLSILSIATQIEQWRKGGSGKKNTWICKAKTGKWEGIDTTGWIACPEGNFSSINSSTGTTSLNGNLPENQQALSFQINRFRWKPGEQLLLAWFDPDDAGNDDLCAIDQFQFSALYQVNAPSPGLIRMDSLSPTQAIFNCPVSTGGGNTRLDWEWDTIPSFNFPETLIAEPASISENTELETIKGRLTQLLPGKKYFVRITATNEIGSTISLPFSFITPELPPLVFTLTPTLIEKQKLAVEILYQLRGVNLPLETGVEWSNSATFSHPKTMRTESPALSLSKILIDQLPSATTLFVRGYARYQTGIAYGNIQIIAIPTSIKIFQLKGNLLTAAQTISYQLETADTVEKLSSSDFTLISQQINLAKVEEIKGSGKNYSIIVNTGVGDGLLQLQLNTPQFCTPSLFGTPMLATGICKIDKTAPLIKRVYYANQSYKSGDTLRLYTEIKPDTTSVSLVQGKWASLIVTHWKKINDSLYLSEIRITEGSENIKAADGISINLQLTDAVGNRSPVFSDTLYYPNDNADAISPQIVSVNAPKSGWFSTGDTLQWQVKFSEPLVVLKNLKNPYLTLQIGNSTKQAALAIQHNTILEFIYVVKPGDFDSAGISWKKNIVLNGCSISDSAGNLAQLSWVDTTSNYAIKIDGIPPVITKMTLPSPGWYPASQWLYFSVTFSEPILIKGDIDQVKMLLSVQSNQQKARLLSVTGNQLKLGYQVQSGTWDKKGVYPLQILLENSNAITDSAGNNALLSWQMKNQNTGIYLDATGPNWIDSSTITVPFCLSDSIISIQSLLSFSDQEPNEKLRVTTANYSGKDSIKVVTDEMLSNGSAMQPLLTILIRNKMNPGKDSLQITVSDSFSRCSKWIFLQPYNPIENNTIQSIPIQCAGAAIPTLQGTLPKGGNGWYQYAWEYASTEKAGFARFGINDSTPYYKLAPLNRSLWVRRKVVSVPCTSYTAPLLIAIKGEGLWRGKNSSNWEDAGNWCTEKIPTEKISVTIPGGTPFSPVLTLNGFCDTLQLLPEGNLYIKGELGIHSIIQSPAASIFTEDGAIRLLGDEPQTLSGEHFQQHTIGSLSIQNQQGVTLTDSMVISRSLSMQRGYLITNSTLWMNNRAVVGPSSDGSFIRGSVNTHWLLDNSKRQYLFSSHPFSKKQPLSLLASQVSITGNQQSDSLFASSPLQLPSAFKLNNIPIEGDSLGILQWIPFTTLHGEGENSWNRAEGIRWLFRGSKGQGLDDQTSWLQHSVYTPNPVAFHFSGELNCGDQVIEFSDSAAGYQLVGNPYLCSIDMSALQISDSIAPHYWVWNPLQGKSGGYTCHLFTESVLIPSYGTFLVRLQGKNQHQLLISEKSKVPYPEKYYGNNRNEIPQQMTWKLFQDSTFYDQVTIRENQKAYNGFDWLDGEKIKNPSHNIYTETYNRQALSIDQRSINSKSYIPLVMEHLPKGKYALQLTQLGLKSENKLYFIDNYTQQMSLLQQDTIFQFEINSDSLSISRNRFLITGKDPLQNSLALLAMYPLTIWPVPATDYLQIKCSVWPEGMVSVIINDFSGRTIRQTRSSFESNGKLQIPVNDIQPGIYTIEIRNPNSFYRACGKWIKQ